MNKIFYHYYENRENGQALIEMFIVLPLFFIILSGFIFIFQQQIREFSDEMAQSAFTVLEVHLDIEERRKADWLSSYGEAQEILEKVTENALNPSAFFSGSVDTKNGVFADKKHVKQNTKHTILSESCSGEPIYDVLAKKDGFFELKTCASGNAYESFDSKFMPDFKGKSQLLSGNSIYYPHLEFTWRNRPFETSRESLAFSASPLGAGFSVRQASLLVPDNGYFNTKCFMESFDPSCSFHAISGKFSRVARDSSRLQITTCFAEAAATCSGTGPGLPACLAGKTAELLNALELGTEAWVCPNTNIALKEVQSIVQKTVYAYSSTIMKREISLRGAILINK